MTFRFSLLCGALLLWLAAGCRRAETPAPGTSAPRPSVFNTGYLRPEAVGAAIEGRPWIAQVTLVDLDHDGLMDIIACEAQKNQVV